MKTNRSQTLVRYLIFTCLAVCFSAALLSAREWKVTFSLPVETNWAGTVLPAGDYCLWLNDVGFKPMVLQRATENIGFLPVLTREAISTPAHSQLLIVREGQKATVHILYVAELGTAFHFQVPERYEVYTRLMARADEPVFIQPIPVTFSGK
jgi:hypothetical protein